ncbi:radical SAM/SPASM domain-containing protein [Algisphaera agarilytica]|uniref:Radical SAM core domain-containing protein n=1 Tax=Algisphaera agarilytica TaxID=1385975 RepID=A0A7X0H4S1_9BACT|nr:radical SAM protein [Algisphaera agarilytica]MBB6429263.1 uncharacterized protein [Algisphaera agarilytica]
MAWTFSDEVTFTPDSETPGFSGMEMNAAPGDRGARFDEDALGGGPFNFSATPGVSQGLSPRRTTIMLKPVGATCNLACDYCYYLPVAQGYEAPAKRMSLDVLESVLAGYLPEAAAEVSIAWQGGEPTLAGLPWFKKMIELVEKHRRPGQTVNHALQTNGTRLNDDWGAFLHQHQFLVGLSLDGLLRDHDHYRKDRQQRGTYQRVLDGRAILQKHKVEHNLLVVLNDRNVTRPREVWRQLMALRTDWIQFIPAVEWVHDPDATGDHAWKTADFSPPGEAYGRFLIHVFDDWFAHHRHRVSVRMFDAVLSILARGYSTECTLGNTCAGQVTLEHDGSVYGCDHFVEPNWGLGQVSPPVSLTCNGQKLDPSEPGDAAPLDTDWMSRLDSPRFETFARRKQEHGAMCRSCDFRRVCNGGCPKHRPVRGSRPAPSALCSGYRMFFAHAMPRLEWLAGYIQRGDIPPAEAPSSIMPRNSRKPRVKTRKKRR